MSLERFDYMMRGKRRRRLLKASVNMPLLAFERSIYEIKKRTGEEPEIVWPDDDGQRLTRRLESKDV